MAEKEIIEQLKGLPSNAQDEVAAFVEHLYKKYSVLKQSQSNRSILDSSFRGMWRHREEMQDSTEWVRNIRKSRRML